VRYGLATVSVVATAAFLRRWGADAAGHSFVLFLPAVVISALFFAQGSGIWAALLSTIMVAGVFSPLAGGSPASDFWMLVLFLVVATGTAAMIETLHWAFFTLAQVGAELAAARDRIAAAEHEKDVLLHEVTHRFKNELATLIGLLRLQARTVDDPVARTELLAASERVHVMGRVHERLSQPGQGISVDIGEFLGDLCADIRKSLIGPRPIALRGDIGGGLFSLTQAMAIGMITNELVTNALKYAFPDDRPGTILVRLFYEKQAFALVVIDDGVGVSPAQASGGGLGERLIRSLAHQLRGTFEVGIDPGGRTCTVRFPMAG
jgi:two-component sensor histidine kinase